ncbi:hypothetical protein ACQ4LE_000077 [Meloidogyne hapla]
MQIHLIIQELIPENPIKPHPKKYPAHIESMIQYKNKLYKNRNSPNSTEKIQIISQKIDYEINKFLRNRENKNLKNQNTKYRYIGNILKPKSVEIPVLIDDNNDVAYAPDHKADLFARTFLTYYQTPQQLPTNNTSISPSKSIQQLNNTNTYSPSTSQPKSKLHHVHISPSEIFQVLTHLKHKTNVSSDMIPEIFLKNCAVTLSYPLSYIFNFALMSETLPQIWKTAIVCPVPKKVSRYPKDYRPISLLSPISKVFEQIIHRYLNYHCNKNNILPESQHGFRVNRSVTTQLIETYNDLALGIETKKACDVVYFDFSKAFDSIPHTILLDKLKRIGIEGPLLTIFKDYLSNRNYKVKIKDTYSKILPAPSGVPQGSILGPTLFLIYISDLPEFCKTPNVTCKMFADDLKIYKIETKNDTNFSQDIQDFINRLTHYCDINHLRINPDKTNVLHLGNKNPEPNYFILNTKIIPNPLNEPVRDLGVYFTKELKWAAHINKITKRAYNTLFSIIRNIKSNSSTLLIQLYKTYIRSILDFASSVYNPYHRKDINKLENIQKTFLKIIYNRSKPYTDLPSYSELLKQYQLDSLEIRRLKADLILFHKYLHGTAIIKNNNLIRIVQTRTRGELFKIQQTQAFYTQAANNSFFIRAFNKYKLLPENLKRASSLNFPKLLQHQNNLLETILHNT